MRLGYITRKATEPCMQHIFQRLGVYLAQAPDTLLFSARNAEDILLACAIGDFSSLSTAFYMFAFRRPDAPPGVADGLLSAILDEAALRGHIRCNLGLGINAGVGFFKKKWGAEAFLPCVETTWEIHAPQKKSWLGRMFS